MKKRIKKKETSTGTLTGTGTDTGTCTGTGRGKWEVVNGLAKGTYYRKKCMRNHSYLFTNYIRINYN